MLVLARIEGFDIVSEILERSRIWQLREDVLFRFETAHIWG